jgi:hypothetical protein
LEGAPLLVANCSCGSFFKEYHPYTICDDLRIFL